jgi:hypothetical protein
LEGPDRQIRLMLKNGQILLRTNDSNSKQSFFEIYCGSVVTSIGGTQAVLSYDPGDNEHLNVQYLRGKLSVIDKNNEYKFGVMPKVGSNIRNIKDKENTTDVTQTQLDYIPEWSELNWQSGVLVDKLPTTIEEIVKINYNRFFDAEDLIETAFNNILLNDNSIWMQELRHHVGGSNMNQATDLYSKGMSALRGGRFQETKDLWEEALAIYPYYTQVKNSLRKLATDHPELKIPETDWKFEKQDSKFK